MRKVKIFKEARNPVQSAGFHSRPWVLEFLPKNKTTTDPIMGWTSSNDTYNSELRLRFKTLAEALEYAKKKDYDCYTEDDNVAIPAKVRPYTEIFKKTKY